jgi:hypothetical protein
MTFVQDLNTSRLGLGHITKPVKTLRKRRHDST